RQELQAGRWHVGPHAGAAGRQLPRRRLHLAQQLPRLRRAGGAHQHALGAANGGAWPGDSRSVTPSSARAASATQERRWAAATWAVAGRKKSTRPSATTSDSCRQRSPH
ncbi:unnamed protein product, partial [Prorocentrum cordatum]